MKPYVAIAMLLVLAIIALGFPLLLDSQKQAPAGPLLRIEVIGGLCPYGGCHSEIVMQKNGHYNHSAGNGFDYREGDLDAAMAGELAALIEKADFDAIRSKGFTGLCPTAYDGAEATYTFYTSRGPESVDSCVSEIDYTSPLFSKLREIEAKIYSSLG
ncbi:MAG: hypothetical protein HY367_04265 [Candidatus Aenigmarchaeota archaeon]|nr:hypothetical protein [Candidatus Aenigmarchaeota archaeon]